jgi:hypothetical protein
MSPGGGDRHEMPSPTLDERALDALLSGSRSAPAGFDWLVPFVEDLGEASSQPAPVIRPALALLLAEGFGPPAAPAPERRARRSRLAARVAAGLGLALAGTTAAGAAGVLPDPAQHAVASVVQAATPFTFPDGGGEAGSGATVAPDAGGRPGAAGVGDSRAVGPWGDDGPAARPDGPQGQAVGPNTGATGLDRASETPAAGHAPTSAPPATAPAAAGGPPAGAGSPAANGLDTAATTPAGDHVPATVPAVTRPSMPPQGGGETPAATRPSVTTPARR